jgi:short-subunit dehydrogenase
MRYNLRPISEQTIVITGATSGNGLATALKAVELGANVVLAARNEEALDRVAEELRSKGAKVATCATDVAENGSAEAIADVAFREFGGFDTWVNDAAVSDYGTLEQIGEAEHRRVFDVNYFGLLQGSLVALKHLRERDGGAIINIGSILSDRALICQIPYSAAKHAVRAFTEGLRMDIDREGIPISVTLIKPGAMHTPFPEHARNHMKLPPRLPQVVYDPDLVADAVLFAAEHPKRQIYVGGQGFALSVLGRLFPRITDLLMEMLFVRGQQSTENPGDPRARDNLFKPRKDGRIEGTQPMYVRRRSRFLQAQKHPVAAAAIAGAAIGASALLASRMMQGRRERS